MPWHVRNPRGLFRRLLVSLEQPVDILKVIQRVIQIKCQFGHLAELITHFLSQLIADGLHLFLGSLQHILCLV